MRTLVLLLITVLTSLGSACGGEEKARCVILDEEVLEVGFAALDVPWRVGAKPGQVGTDENSGLVGLYAKLISGVLPIVTQRGFLCTAPPYYDCDVDTCSCVPPDPETMIESLTDWSVGLLEQRVEAVVPGVYNNVFEPGEGVELPPDVKVTVVRRGCEKVAIVRGDLYIMHDQLRRRVAALVEERTGIGFDQIFLAATHNHSTPHAISAAPGVWLFADGFDPRHFVYLSHKIADAIVAADEARRPATLRVAQSELHGIGHNIIGPGQVDLAIGPEALRSLAPDGASGTIQVGYPYDHIDAALSILRFDDAETGEPISFIFVFGMHPETLPTGHAITSGEWPRHVEEKIAKRLGVSAMWLPGSLGDSEPDKARVSEHDFMRSSFEQMDLMTDLIFDAVKTLYEETGSLEGDARPPVAQLSRHIPGPSSFPLPTSSYISLELPLPGQERLPFLRVTHDTAAFPLHLVRLGSALLVGVPAEVTTDLSLNIKSRVDREEGVYTGYVWEGAPQWVREQVARNFSSDEIDPADGISHPVLVNHTNAWIGYIVTRWEHTTRAHYRESLTAYGPGTANHVAESVLGLYRELIGKGSFNPKPTNVNTVDNSSSARVEAFLAGLDEQVTEMSRAFPVSSAAEVGTVLTEPTEPVTEGDPVELTWQGGTNDMDIPRIRVEEDVDGTFTPVAEGPSAQIFLYFSPPDVWTARLLHAPASSSSLRFAVEGTYRGPTPGASTPDPIWDPDGANVRYELTSSEFTVTSP
jgi:hypothetical protein